MSRHYIQVLSFIGLFFVLVGCGDSESEEEKEEAAKSEANKSSIGATQVAYDSCQDGTYYFYLKGNGSFRPEKMNKYTADVEGTIRRLPARVGQLYNQGSLLLQFESDEANLDLEKALLNIEKAELEFENTLIGFPEGKSASKAERDSLLQRLRVSSGLADALLEKKSAQNKLNKLRLTAPYAGYVVDLEVTEGSPVKAGDELFSFYSSGNMLLDIYVLESDLKHLKSGFPVEIRPLFDAENAIIEGKVRHINPKVDESGQVKVTVETRTSANIVPGMNAEVVIKIPYPNRMWVPKKAVVIRSGRPVVFTVDNNRAKWNYVEIGMDNGKEVEILEGIDVGSTVITSNNLQLAHDAPVELKKENISRRD
ncbi:MAG: efflux RND transporter periplasmic adaptor subunit [Cyclobacteriaceae bacterium]|nr:efflux RND transporter periplasmic adaptor subunit [Cyclobacteriaceae bacterium]MCH8517036.1 efflux RND transporter periplasmic adaptor subunit [Cyclobacteriaceae bacterium]